MKTVKGALKSLIFIFIAAFLFLPVVVVMTVFKIHRPCLAQKQHRPIRNP